jgi:hypothetical protein
MAISNLGAFNSLSDLQIPAGYTRPTVAAFSDFEYVRTVTLNIAKTTVEAATPQATMLAIFNNSTVGINKQIVDLIALDFLATATVTTYGQLISLTTNVEVGNFNDQNYLTNAAVSYKATVNIYVKAL